MNQIGVISRRVDLRPSAPHPGENPYSITPQTQQTKISINPRVHLVVSNDPLPTHI